MLDTLEDVAVTRTSNKRIEIMDKLWNVNVTLGEILTVRTICG